MAVIVEPNFSSRAFTLLGGWVDASWGIALTIAGFGGGVVFGSGGAFSALFGNRVEELSGCGITFDAVVADFIVAIGTF